MQENTQCRNEFSTTNIKDTSIIELFQLLNEGEIKTCNLRPFKEATLILGNSGCGKTTFTRRIAGYGSTLRSVLDVFDYKIVSSNGIVNNESFVTSDTKFPELVANGSSGAVYYDFPGFKDTRGPAHDIATTYFIKKIVDNVERVKMLVLINYISLTEQGTRDDFTSLLQHVTKFVKNIEKYKDGVALIATKVAYPKVPDNIIISSIAKFIEKVEQDLKNRNNPSKDYSEVIKLINIMLQKEGDTYPKIAISRSPDDEGLLSEISLLKVNEERIKTKLAKLKFVQKDDTDFGYIIPKQSLMDISNLINQINDSIADIVREIGQEIQKYLSADEDRIRDIGQFLNLTSLKYNELQNVQEKANTQDTVQKCTQEVISGVASFNINSAHLNNTLLRYGNYSTFLGQVSDNAIDNKFKCADGLQDVITYSFKFRKWYHFLDNLYERLSSYDIQSDIANSPCTVFADQATKAIRDKTISAFKFNQPDLKRCYPYYESQLEDIKDVIIDEPKLNAIEKVLNSTMMDNTFYSCDDDKLVIKGHFLKLKDILDIQERECRASPKFIEIFALNEVFINADLNKTGDQVQLSIIAPVWNIQGSRRITLDGRHGQPISPPKSTERWPNGTGVNGQEGLPGGPGGNFIGIGETFENLQRLTVSVRGGNGGPGQEGADGARGDAGKDASNDVYMSRDWLDWAALIFSAGLARIGVAESKNHDIVDRDGNYVVKLAGKNGTHGSDGGDGGSGGRGGNTGKIIFAPLSSMEETNHLHTVTGMGTGGSGGKGGKGGTGGLHGHNLTVDEPVFAGAYRSSNDEVKKRYERAPAGNRGRDGITNDSKYASEENYRISNLPDTVNDYINYATENLQRSVRESYVTEFVNKLKNDARFKSNTTRRRRHIKMPKALKPAIRRVRAAPISADQFAKQPYDIVTDDSTTYATNTGIRIQSPINFAANLLSNFFGQRKLIGASNILDRLVKSGTELLFRDPTPSNIRTTAGRGNTHGVTKYGNFSVNESLILVDLAVRSITKEKFYTTEEQSVDFSQVTATALNIISEFEQVLSEISVQNNLLPEYLEFDPVKLISDLEKELINKNYQKVGRILYQSIERNNYKKNPQFHTHILGKLDEILKTQGKRYFNMRNIENGNFKSHNVNNDFNRN